MIENRIARIARIANRIMASIPEKEVERLLGVLLRGTPFAHKTHAVGGFVRDEVMGLDAKDLDVVVEIKGGADKITHFIHDKFPDATTNPHKMGAGYPIWQITFTNDLEFKGSLYLTNGAVIEFVDTQKEMFPDPNSRQRTVEYGTLNEDIERRDFTVNMLLKDLTSGEIVDLTGMGLSDIKNGILRGNPNVDFDKILRDDPLRMMRAIRFQAKYGWNVPMDILKAIRRNANRIQIVSAERIQGELIKMMKIGKLAQGIRMMKAVGLLKYIFPEVQAMSGVEHEYSKGIHQEGDCLKHTLLVLQGTPPGVESQLAALLHDVGKPQSRKIYDGLITFRGHEDVGGEIAEGILRRLKFDGGVIHKVRRMVENHMRPLHLTTNNAGPSGIRRFIKDVGEELVDAVLTLAEADALGTLPPNNMIPDLRQKIDALKVNVQKAEILPIDGRDIQRLLNIRPGKIIGDALKFLGDQKFELSQRGIEMDKKMAENIVLKEFGGKNMNRESKIVERVVVAFGEQNDLVVLNGSEDENKKFYKFLHAIKYKKEVQFDWTTRKDGVYTKHTTRDVPRRVSTGERGRMVHISGLMIPFSLIGRHADVERRLRKEEEEALRKMAEKKKQEEEKIRGVMPRLEKILEVYPALKKYLNVSNIREKYKTEAVDVLWYCLTGKGYGQAKIGWDNQLINEYKNVSELAQWDIVVKIRSGDPWDVRRISIEEDNYKRYKTDDEGNRW